MERARNGLERGSANSVTREMLPNAQNRKTRRVHRAFEYSKFRSTKLLNFRKCERFTLSFEEIEKLKDEFDPAKHSISTVKRRDQTMAATTASVTDKRNQKMTTKYGSVKTYLFELALSRGWKSNAFKQTKVDLRKQYAIPRKSLKIEIQKMSKDVLLKLLNSFSKARTHFQISSSISLN